MARQSKVLDELVESLAKSLLIGEIARAKVIIGQGALTQEQRKGLVALTSAELTGEANMCSVAVQLWHQLEAAAYTKRVIDEEEKKRRGLDNLPGLLQ